MLPFFGIAIAVGLFFGLLSLGAAGKAYHLLRRKKKLLGSGGVREPDVGLRREDSNDCGGGGGGKGLLCWRKPSPVHDNVSRELGRAEPEQEDPEMGFAAAKSFSEEGVEEELMRLHNLCGPPRFLFTIKEETVEDLASDDGKPTMRLIDLMRAADANNALSPIASPLKRSPGSPFYCNGLLNPLFESSAEAELMSRLRSSPPPKFKFLRDAEEKLLYRKLQEEAEKHGKGGWANYNGCLPMQVQPRSCGSEVVTVHDAHVLVISG
uniref:Uncharacterized protein n=1 Tax=Kalanchoe fedtschenkoi TaxID=63787 RepID=A0A7N0TD10_KALFE